MEHMKMAEKMQAQAQMPAENDYKAGYAFVPVQVVRKFYDHDSALICGTIFPELCIPQGKYGPNEEA